MGRRARGTTKLTTGFCHTEASSVKPITTSVRVKADASPVATAAPQHTLEEAEIVAAVASLYDDQLRPYGRILRKRLVERAQATIPGVIIDAGKLRNVCEASMKLEIQAEDGGEWSALLLDRQPVFIDVYNGHDDYPEELWAAVAEYLEGLTRSPETALPGGRYASAQALAARQLPFLADYSLGQVCHITQIAISHRKLLGYLNGAIVPYDLSTSMVKSRCAEQQRPCASQPRIVAEGIDVSTAPSLPVAEWDQARTCMREILETAKSRGLEQVPLSNVKRLFRSQYSMELSETVLGHAKLSELLQDPKFHDICTVQLLDRGYVVLPPSVPVSMPVKAASCKNAMATTPSPTSKQPPLLPFALPEDSGLDLVVKNTFINAEVSPPRAGAVRGAGRSHSVPKDLGSGQPALKGINCHARGFFTPPLEVPPVDDKRPNLAKFCPFEPLSLEDADPYDEAGGPQFCVTPSPQPQPHYRLAATAPLLGNECRSGLEQLEVCPNMFQQLPNFDVVWVHSLLEPPGTWCSPFVWERPPCPGNVGALAAGDSLEPFVVRIAGLI